MGSRDMCATLRRDSCSEKCNRCALIRWTHGSGGAAAARARGRRRGAVVHGGGRPTRDVAGRGLPRARRPRARARHPAHAPHDAPGRAHRRRGVVHRDRPPRARRARSCGRRGARRAIGHPRRVPVGRPRRAHDAGAAHLESGARRRPHAARAAEPPRRRPGRGARRPRGAAASRRPRARLRARRHRAAGRRRADRPSARRPGDRRPRRPGPVHGRPRPAHGHDLRRALDLGGARGAADDRDRRRRGVARPHRRGRRHRRHGGGHRAPLSASGRRVRADRRRAADRGAPRLAPPVPASVRRSGRPRHPRRLRTPTRSPKLGCRDGCTDRDLRLRRRRSHGGPCREGPAAARVDPLHRRPRALALRPEEDRRRARLRARRARRPRRAGREDARDRLQHGLVGDAARRARALRRAGRRGDPARRAACGGHHAQRPRRRDRHRGHRAVARLRRRVRRGPAPRAVLRGVPALRRVRRGRRDQRRRAALGRRGVPRAASRGRRRHARARLHALPVPEGRDLVRDGGAGVARLERRRDRQRRLPRARLERHGAPVDAPPSYRYEATGGSTSAFLDLAHRLIAPEIPSVELVQTGVLTIPHHARLRQENA